MKGPVIAIAIITIALYLTGGCVYKGYSHIEELKDVSPDVWERQGYTPIAYEGYSMGYGLLGTSFGSAQVWWRLRHPDTNVNYSGYIVKWGGEYHVYGPKATDAIKPN